VSTHTSDRTPPLTFPVSRIASQFLVIVKFQENS
jgi:hypothetical protein